jgi:hypothetical protein
VPPRVPQPRTSPPCCGEFHRCHVSLSSGPCLLDEVRSDAATCPMAPSSAFLRVELRCCHVPHGPSGLWTTGIKKGLAALGTQLGSRVFKARSCITKASVDVQAAIVHLYSAPN